MVRYSTFPTALFLSFAPSPNRDYRHAYARLYAEGHLTRSSPMHGYSPYSMHFESIIPDGTPVYALFMQIDRCDVVPRKSCVILRYLAGILPVSCRYLSVRAKSRQPPVTRRIPVEFSIRLSSFLFVLIVDIEKSKFSFHTNLRHIFLSTLKDLVVLEIRNCRLIAVEKENISRSFVLIRAK